MHIHTYRFLTIFALFFTFACKSKKAVVTPTPVPEIVKIKEDPNKAFLANIEKKIYTPNFFNAKASIGIVTNGNSVDFDAVIQFRKDSAILLVAKKFGFEVGRALITPDSLFIINRIQQEYDAKPLSAIASKFSLPPRFDLIQDMIMGNPMNLAKAPYKINIKDSLATLSSNYQALTAICAMDKKTFLLYQSTIDDASNGGEMTMDYKDYRNVSAHDFSFSRILSGKSSKTGALDVDLKFNEIEFDKPKVIRFELPRKYKRMD
jgi:hypothetical protein